MKTDPTFWLMARASGLAAYVLVTASMLAGLVLKARPFGSRIRPARVTEVHRALAFASIGMLAVHGSALVADTAVDISPAALVVPGLVDYRPLWVALGVVAGWLLVVVTLSFSLRKRIGTRTWRRLHWLTYVVFAAATAHGLAAGSDSDRPWVILLYAVAVGAVVTATVWRTLAPARPTARRARAAASPVAAARSLGP